MWQQLWGWLFEPEIQKLFFFVVAALVIGFTIGRGARYPKETKTKPLSREGDQAFFKGIQYILSNAHDQAIEEFTKSVQVNSDTVETYVALGNLYRSKGDIDRAIRIRQSLILRPNIDEQIRLRALFDLGLDYRKGGFLDRALDAYSRVLEKEPTSVETLAEVEKIYEEMKDWANAFATRKKLSGLIKGEHGHILAHHQTEMGKAYHRQGELAKAKACYKWALSLDEHCVDAYLHLGDLYFGQQDYQTAITSWKKVVKVAPQFTFLAYRRLEGAYARMENLSPVEEFLKECAKMDSDAFTHVALARYLYNEQDYEGALRELKNALDLNPSFWEARKFMGEILLARGMEKAALAAFQDLIARLNVPYLKFQCTNCGFRANELQWQCPQCRKWDTINLVDAPSSPEPPLAIA